MAAVDTDVLIIGAGCSGIGLAVQLKRKLGHNNFRILEKSNAVGGTWHSNTYPGCRCDVPSHLYSFSFAPNPDWPYLMSSQPEIQSYFASVASKYDIYPHISFGTAVDSAVWQSAEQRWLLTVTDIQTKSTYQLTARAIVSSVGSLSIPKKCTIPGAETFQGKLFHSAEWDHTFDWSNKKVITIGNGCSATQFVPVMTKQGPKATGPSSAVKSMVQFSRQPHYLFELKSFRYTSLDKAAFRYIPGWQRLYRWMIWLKMETDFYWMHTKNGQKTRERLLEEHKALVKRKAPERYQDDLIFRHEIGCKRKVIDTDYLACLHRPNMELISNDPIAHIEPTGIRTQSGRLVEADAIVLATGFELHRFLFPMKIIGEAGLDLHEHYAQHTGRAPAAYLGTVTPSFPNFFTMMGPNTLTGHSSVIFTSECQILATLGLLKPILSKPLLSTAPTAVSVKPTAAARDLATTRAALKDYVWSSGCTSWALDPDTNENIAMYHHYQWHFWLRCLFLRGGDFEYTYPKTGGKRSLRVGFGWQYARRAALTALLLAYLGWSGKAQNWLQLARVMAAMLRMRVAALVGKKNSV